MDFRLKRPCAKCPFRKDCQEGWLSSARAREIAKSITVDDAPFACHETTEATKDAPGEEQHCAGALILLEKAGHPPGQLARVAERLGHHDPDALDTEAAPVFDSIEDFVEHHANSRDEVFEAHASEPCSVAEGGCLAPAGYMTAAGVVEEPDPGPTTECTHCGEPVCEACTCLCAGARA